MISDPHGSGANVEDDDGRTGGEGNMVAGSIGGHLENTIPPGITVTEEQRAEFDRARQTQASLSPVPSQKDEDEVSEGTMAMLRLMQRQMEMQMLMMKRMEERDEKRREEEVEPKEKVKWRGVKLDIKHFSRVEVFNGEHAKFRDWFFGVNTAIGQIDQKLSGAIKTLLEEDNALKAEDLPSKENNGVPEELKDEYTTELFGLLVQLTGGEAKEMCTAYERDFGEVDGFDMIVKMNRRFDPMTGGTLLSAFLDVVSPPKVGNNNEIVSAIFKWEAKITNVLKRYGESIGPKLKTAILVAMMPKGIKEDLLKHSCMQTSLKYEGCKEFLIKFSNQEAALSKATPKASINQMGEEDIEVDALMWGKGKGKGGGCWNCGGTGHLAAQCPTPKGNGKGPKGTWKGGGKGLGGKAPYKGKTGVGQLEEGGEDGQEQEVNVFMKGKGKGGKDWYGPYQGAWNNNPNGIGYQGICWNCGEVGHQQRECPKTIQRVDCDNIECDFFFGAVVRYKKPYKNYDFCSNLPNWIRFFKFSRGIDADTA